MNTLTPEQRQALFLEMLNQAIQQTGVKIVALTRARSFDNGQVTQIEAELGFALVPGWTPEPDSQSPQPVQGVVGQGQVDVP
jgi:hypothetical protein